MGSGATAAAAVDSKRKFVGFEISEPYVALSQRRLLQNGTGGNGLNKLIVDLLNDPESVSACEQVCPLRSRWLRQRHSEYRGRNGTIVTTGQE